MSTTEEYLETCVKLSSSSNDELFKSLMDKSFNAMDDVDTPGNQKLPSGSELIRYKPSRSQFTEYASKLMRTDFERGELLKEILKDHVEVFTQSLGGKRKINYIQEPEPESEEESESESDPETLESDGCDSELPLRLQPATTFHRGKIVPSSSMISVTREYFPDSKLIYPGVYKTPEGFYVLFVIDNGKYSNVWAHDTGVTTLTWTTPYKDTNRETMMFVSRCKIIHVFRKRNNETFFRYMGKFSRVKNIKSGSGKIDIVMC